MNVTIKVKCQAVQYDGSNLSLIEDLLKSFPCSIFHTNNILHIRWGIWKSQVNVTDWVIMSEFGEMVIMFDRIFQERVIR